MIKWTVRRIALIYKELQDAEKVFDVFKMQSRRWFIKNIEGLTSAFFGEFTG